MPKRPVHPHGPFFVCRIDAGRGVLSGRTLSVSLRSTALPSGRALGKEGRFRPHRSTAGRSLPLSSKLFAPAKASPFRERWHGKAVTERVAPGTNPLSRLRRQLSRRESPWQNQQVSSSPVNGRKKPAVKQQTFRLCQSLSLSREVARRSRDGEGHFQNSLSQSAAGSSCPVHPYPLQTQKARRRVLQRAFDGSCGVAALSAAQQCLTPARPGPEWWNARSPSLPHGGCPRYGAWPPGSSLP